MPVDQTITCRDCNTEFVWTSGEQEFFASKGFQNPPVRCPACRAAKRGRSSNFGSEEGGYQPHVSRELFEVTCADCGGIAKVPFQPKGDRPVYCADCFRSHR